MVSIDAFRKLALAMPDTDEHPHFHLFAFRVRKKIFATLHANDNRAMLKLEPVEQSVYCDYDNSIFFPVPGAWGKQGCTFVDLKKVKTTIFREALTTAYEGVALKHPAKKKK
jgi:predicted DNA-binding protein (MmcQ/YjbR family)